MNHTEVKAAADDARFSPLHPKRTTGLTPILWVVLGAISAFVLAYLANGLDFQNKWRTPASTAPVIKQPQPLASSLSPQAGETPTKIRFGPLTRKHFDQFDEWIETAPQRQYFIQLLATDAQHTGEIEGFLAKASEYLNPEEIRAYRSSLSGRDRVGVIYGSYPTREAAAEAMLALPESIKAAQPFPRQVSRLR